MPSYTSRPSLYVYVYEILTVYHYVQNLVMARKCIYQLPKFQKKVTLTFYSDYQYA